MSTETLDPAAIKLLSRGADEILKREELEARLKLGRPLRIKAGSAPARRNAASAKSSVR